MAEGLRSSTAREARRSCTGYCAVRCVAPRACWISTRARPNGFGNIWVGNTNCYIFSSLLVWKVRKTINKGLRRSNVQRRMNGGQWHSVRFVVEVRTYSGKKCRRVRVALDTW
jgi:hypothetical protein